MATTVILGGGFGGLAAARALVAVPDASHRIVLVDRAERFIVGAGQTWIMLGNKTLDDVSRARTELVPKGVELVRDEVASIDAATRTVQLKSGPSLTADQLVVALGAEYDFAQVPGLADAHTFYTPDGAEKLRDELQRFAGGRVILLVARSPFKCPPAPYEGALLVHGVLKKRLGEQVKVEVHTLEPAPMPSAGPTMGGFLRDLMQKEGVGFFPGRKAIAVDGKKKTVTFEGGIEEAFDLLIAIPPHVAPAVVRSAGLAPEGGWITVDPFTLATKHDGVWAIGDVNAVPLPGRFKPEVALALPKAGIFAEHEGRIVAAQIIARVRGGASDSDFDGKGFCFAEVGAGQAVRAEGNFFALPAPDVKPAAPPDRAQYEHKVQWIHDLLNPKQS